MEINNNTADCNDYGPNRIGFTFEDGVGVIQYWRNVDVIEAAPNLLSIPNENSQPIRRNNHRRQRINKRDTLTNLSNSATSPQLTLIIRTPTPIRPIQQPRREQRPACTKRRARLVHVGRTYRGANHVWLTHH